MKVTFQRGETLIILYHLTAREGETFNPSSVASVSAKLKKVEEPNTVPSAATSPAATFIAQHDGLGTWKLQVLAASSANLAIGGYVVSIVTTMTDGQVIIEDPVWVYIQEATV